MPVDHTTDRFGLELPNEANTLKHDVARLVTSFTQLEEKAAILDDAGKIVGSQYDDAHVAVLKAPHLWIDDSVIPDNIPRKGTDGKIKDEDLHDDVKTVLHTAVNEIGMTQLSTATAGDFCHITQAPYKTYVLCSDRPEIRSAWCELVARAVTTVNGRNGDVVVAEAGENSDITGLHGLVGPLSLGGDAQGDNDAVTLRQLRSVANAGAGGGPNMSGVMNNFIGAVEWFNGSRLNLPAGYVAADGQELKRTDYPDLWAAISSSFLNSVTQTLWDTKSTNARGAFYYNRGSYSQGDGDLIKGTTFRVPDLNGGQTGSIANTFLNGSAPNLSNNVGQVRESAAPNITGGINPMVWNAQPTGTGAFVGINGTPNVAGNQGTANVMGMASYNLDASRSDKVYTGSAGELRPNTAVGIWIIRANGSFQAADTIFEVINAYNPMPVAGKTINSGMVQGSIRDENNITVNAVGMNVTNVVGQQPKASFGVGNWVKNTTNNEYSLAWKHMDLDWGTGNLTGPADIYATPVMRTYSGRQVLYGQMGIAAGSEPNSVYFTNQTAGVVNRVKGEWYTACWELFAVRDQSTGLAYASWRLTPQSNNATHYFEISMRNDGSVALPGAQMFALDGTVHFPGNLSVASTTYPSDRTLKDNIKPISDALRKIQQLNGYTFDFKADGKSSAGVIAQEVQTVLPEIVEEMPDGHLGLQYNGLIGLLVEAVKELQAEVAELKAKA
ncbi:TPA: tail fiber domain-containing protein [Salmonella enterica subsp. enterica serovar Newport]